MDQRKNQLNVIITLARKTNNFYNSHVFERDTIYVAGKESH